MDQIIYVGVAGIVVAVVEVIKVFLTPRVSPVMLPKLLPLIVLMMSMGIYVAVAMMYQPFVLLDSLKMGFLLGILSSGIYGMGKAIIGTVPAVQPPA